MEKKLVGKRVALQAERDSASLPEIFSHEQVARLHKYQFGPFEKFQRMHPYTCPNRGNGNHFENGRDQGVLIPTTRGWICQCCEYTQSWAHPFMHGGEDA